MDVTDGDTPKLISVHLMWTPEEPEMFIVAVQGRNANLELTRRDLNWLLATMKRVHLADRARSEAMHLAAIEPFVDLRRALCERAREQAQRLWQWLKDWAALMRQLEAADGTPAEAPSDHEDADQC